MKIGFFDSGLGGLTVMKEVIASLPSYDYEFYGDTANLPYGDKTEDQIYELTKKGVTHLFERDCMLVVLACNTASAETLRRLQDTFLVERYSDRRILGVIIPMVESVIETKSSKLLLLATTRTIHSKKYEKEFEKMQSELLVFSVATPELVPLIERGKKQEAVKIATTEIKKNLAEGIDTVILGCTHYGLLRANLEREFGSTLRILSADQIIPKKLQSYLQAHPEIKSKLSQGRTRNIYLSKHTQEYDKLMGDMLGSF